MAAGQKKDDVIAPVEMEDLLFSFRENVWHGDQEPRAEIISRVVEAVRPRTLIVSAPSDAPASVGRTALRSPAGAGKGIVATTSGGTGPGSNILYRTKQDAARALLELNQERVEKQAKELDRARGRLRVAHELFTKISGGAAVIVAALLAVLAVAVAPSPAAAQSSGFQPGVNAPVQNGARVSVVASLSRPPAARGRTAVAVRVFLYRAPRGGAPGTLVAQSAPRTMSRRVVNLRVSVASTRERVSRSWVWFGVIRYTVKDARGRSIGLFQGVGAARSFRLR